MREEKRVRAAEERRTKDNLLKMQVNFKDRDTQASIERMNQLKAEHNQLKAEQKNLRMQTVKDNAHSLAK